MKSLVKEGFDIDPSLKVDKVSKKAIEQFLKKVEDRLPDFHATEFELKGSIRQFYWMHCTCIRKVVSKLLRGKN